MRYLCVEGAPDTCVEGAPDIQESGPNETDNNAATATQVRHGSDSTEQQFGAVLMDILTNPTFDFLSIFTICDLLSYPDSLRLVRNSCNFNSHCHHPKQR